MLISRRNDRLVLVDQNEHGRLAGDLCEHWGNDDFARPVRPESARVAAAMHDEGWREADAAPLFNPEEARPLHFLEIDMFDHIPLYGRGVERVFGLDPYAGLLVSMHWTGLYRGRWGMQTGAVGFKPGATEVEKLQDEVVDKEERRWMEVKRGLMKNDRRSEFEAGLWHNYDLLQSFDLLSLYASLIELVPGNGEEPQPVAVGLRSIDLPRGPRIVESVPTRVGGERVDLLLTPVDDDVVTVDPYPFDVDRLEVALTARTIPDQRYESQGHARDALGTADEVTLGCTLIRP